MKQLHAFVRTLLAILAAAAVPALLFGIEGNAAFIAFILALAWILVLGLPTFLILKGRGCVRWWSALLSGFLLAAIPVALLGWPYFPGNGTSYSGWDGHGMVDFVVNGIPTHAGWIQYFTSTLGSGALGSTSALAFWLVWRLSGNRETKPANNAS
ncbi:hypothetical protein [Oleiagrimonas soli]|uniref:Transmembrane protein n=1 Tax=Oleiagrimonas soli TaxID=1543381 RepID=A0A099CW83_9GAMM|nr:hypothetical protein [Oleiagrimonas soli]KGI77897.1 hypothetical protein LF63_0105710 [Oleiagrimonas soli]MBB6183740.1 hypothetical protein [Oleiagrimonas soli]